MKSITVKELDRLKAADPQLELIDVRTPAEFNEVHVEYAVNVPLDKLNPREFISTRKAPADKPVYVICRSGKRSSMAAERLMAAGCTSVVNVEGGTTAAISGGLNVRRGDSTMSIERQVQIAAGSMIVAGVLLSWWLDIQAISLLPAAIGAGLVFSGLTNSCAMGSVLAKMPWNRRGSTCSSGKS